MINDLKLTLNMNILEKAIYNIIKNNPKIKNVVRDVYQFILSAIPVKQKGVKSLLVNKQNYFFGFHDKCPWSFDEKYLLANKFSIPNRKINATDLIVLGIFKGVNYENFVPLYKTNTFNWQQGCMLQWIGNKNEIIFNNFDGTKHISIIIDINGKELKKIPLPVTAISKDGKYALSYNFSRLTRYAPGYGYENGNDDEIDVKIPNQDGLHLIDIETGIIKKIFTISQIASIEPNESMENSFHYFTHCLFSPSGNRFVFFHRWIRDMNYVNTRMFSCDLNGNNIFLFPTNGMISHIGWKDENKILAYCNTIKYGDSYILFEDGSNNYTKVGSSHFTSDGHPSFSPVDNRWFITDTYPDRFRLSSLILFDCLNNKRYNLVKLKQPLNFKEELRCDLHPRWNRNGTMVCFDSAHSGIRSLCVLKIKDILKEYD